MPDDLPDESTPEVELAEPDYVPVPVIADDAGLADAVARLGEGHGPIAVDAERASGFRYSQRAYLVQLFRRGTGAILIDPIGIDDFSPLQEAIGDVEWVLHAASQDLPCLRELGLEPAHLFDTELAARLLGMPRVGLGAVVADQLGIHLAKEHSAADWSTRPLPDAWLKYATLDVTLLVDLRDEIAARLEETGKTRIAAEEFAAVLTRDPKPPAAEPWRRLSGVHQVRNTRGLAVARSLWQARDAYAQEVDTAPGRLLPDRSIVAVALNVPADRRALLGMKDFTGRASRSQGDRWWAAVADGLATTELPTLRAPGGDSLPPPRAWADRNPDADRRLRIARTAVQERSEQLQLPTENLLTPDTLRRIAWAPPAPVDAGTIGAALAAADARPWQIDATAQLIADAFVAAAQSGAEADSAAS